MKGKGVILLLLIGVAGYVGYRLLPPQYNPLVPFTLDDPPGKITQFKLHRLTEERCPLLLTQASDRGWVNFRQLADTAGPCPLHKAVRIMNFGEIKLSSSFLASCSLALSSTLFAREANKIALDQVGSKISQIDHLGSFACRNIYHRQNARLSEHATADALDISGFRLQNGRKITVLQGWQQAENQAWLRATLAAGCHYYGNGLGPEYNAAHANHFHLGMRGYGLCR